MVQLGHGPGCVTSLHELPHLRICQLLRCLVFVCATTAACSSSTSTPATQTPIFNGLVGIRLAGLMLTFCWYTPWGATGAADGAGAGVGAGPGRGARGARGGPGEPLITNQLPAKLNFRQSQQPRSLKLYIINSAGISPEDKKRNLNGVI